MERGNAVPGRSRARGRRGVATWVLLVALGVGWGAERPAQAQALPSSLQTDFGDLLRVLTDLATQVGTKSRGELFSFLNRVELFNLESEVDRLVGNPWELSDSTSYKLSLAPLHVAYPVFDQQVRQMTRLDDIRTRRIQNLTVDSLGLIAVELDLLDEHRSGSQLGSSVLRYFNAREVLDLGVFVLAQQPLFPRTPEEWDERKRQLARNQAALAVGVAGVGALFEAGALSNSGTIKRCRGDKCSVGWYAGFSRLGYHLQPTLRGGLTGRLPRLEMSVGWMEQVRPAADGADSVLELAVRESWLGRYTHVAGWDSFFVGAVRQVVSAEGRYQGEWFTARGGLFVKRDRPFRLRHVIVRGSTEVESDFTGSLRYAMGFGVDYTRTGLSAVVQSSRTNVSRDGARVPETRTGLFVAGTIEPPDQYFIHAMQVRSRRLREEWNYLVERELERRQTEAELRVLAAGKPGEGWEPLIEALRRTSAESEEHRARVAVLLGDYLEGRRLVYSIKQWKVSPDDSHGPLDGEMLEAATRSVFARLAELAYFLQGAQGTLENLRDRYTRVADNALSAGADEPSLRQRADADLADIDRQWRRSSDSVSEGLRLYEHYLASARRIAAVATGLSPVRHFEPLAPHTIRKLLTLVAQPLR